MTLKKLKPCPFCGVQPKQAKPLADDYCFCPTRGCVLGSWGHHIRKKEWNTRPKAGGWISVKEGLPEIGQKNSVDIWHKTYGRIPYCFLDMDDDETWWEMGPDDTFEMEDVTHWKPLPEPPEAK